MTKELLTDFPEDGFRFSCHRDIKCFNKCCSDLRLILTPYDLIMLKNRLGMSSEEFLEKHTEDETSEDAWFPIVKLKMDPGTKECPFVTPDGCSIYGDRPGACRTYPLARAASKPGDGEAKEHYMVVHEDHCQGHQEAKTWTLEMWKTDQGIDQYNAMNDVWMEVITNPALDRLGEGLGKKIKMFYMASYDIDTFRRFVFETSFLNMFKLDDGLVKKIKEDDVELMRFAVKWLRFSLFGENTLEIDNEILKKKGKGD